MYNIHLYIIRNKKINSHSIIVYQSVIFHETLSYVGTIIKPS